MNILSKMEFKKPSNKRKLEEDTDTCFNAKRKNSGTTESTGKKIKKIYLSLKFNDFFNCGQSRLFSYHPKNITPFVSR